jgi:hypothetical protein
MAVRGGGGLWRNALLVLTARIGRLHSVFLKLLKAIGGGGLRNALLILTVSNRQ